MSAPTTINIPMSAARPWQSPALRRGGIALFFLLLAWLQLGVFVHREGVEGAWFLYGSDTVSHDLPVQWWLWNEVRGTGVLPLWMDPVRGGMPSVGGFLWAPLSPSLWLYGVLETPAAQRAQFLFALWVAGMGGFWLARVMGLRRSVALLVGTGVGLSGHLVTLIHAGHLQKVLALAWMPWFAGGMVLAFAAQAPRRLQVRGVVVGGLALGMAFLSGHPQVAFMMAGLAGLRLVMELPGARGRRRIALPALMAGIVLLGMMVGAFQLVAGTEMGRVSNRAGGVSFEEATATSYPPGELAEFFLPRLRGDNSASGWNEYRGDWGERIVSDYAGVLLVVLVLVAMLSDRRREVRFWNSALILSILVGVGSHLPLYRALHEWLPGMNSFRSPGTFLAVAALAIPVLAGLGTEHLVSRWGSRGALLTCGGFGVVTGLVLVGSGMIAADEMMAGALRRSGAVLLMGGGAVVVVGLRGLQRWLILPLVLTTVTMMDLALANRAFLRAEPWGNYALYMEPTPLDLWALEGDAIRRVHEVGREASLRPLFSGREALLGYHPIDFALYSERIGEVGIGTPEWREEFGVEYLWLARLDEELPAPFAVAARPGGGRGGLVVRDTTVSGVVRGDTMVAHRWFPARTANERELEVTLHAGGEVEVLRLVAPGWSWEIVGRTPREAVATVALRQRIEMHSGTGVIRWEYRPTTFRHGLFLTMMGLVGCLALLFATTGRRGEERD